MLYLLHIYNIYMFYVCIIHLKKKEILKQILIIVYIYYI